MQCRSCGATIAAKAIVCYKCGTPTEDHVPVSRTAGGPSRSAVIAIRLAIVLVVTLLAVWLIPKTPDGTWMRYAAWAAVPVTVFLLIRLTPAQRSSRLRRR